MEFIISIYLLCGYWATNFIYRFMDEKAKQACGRFKPESANEVLAVFLFWPVTVTLALAVWYWPLNGNKG